MSVLLDDDAPYKLEIKETEEGYFYWIIDMMDEHGTFHSIMSDCNHEVKAAAFRCAGNTLSNLSVGFKMNGLSSFLVH